MRFVATFPATVASVPKFIIRTFIAYFKTHRSSDFRSGFADTFSFIIACDESTAYKFRSNGSVVFEFVTDGNPVAPPVAAKRIFITDDLYLYCLDEDTGDLVWKFAIDDYGLGITADGSKVAVSTEYTLFVLRYDGLLLFKINEPKPLGATSEDFLFFFGISAGKDVLVRIDDAANILWKAETSNLYWHSAPTRYKNRIFSPAPACFSADDGHLIWSATPPSEPSSQCLALSAEKLFYNADMLYCMDINGNVERSASIAFEMSETDVSASDFIYAFGSGIFKFSFSLEQIWRYLCNQKDRSALNLPPPSQTAHRDVVVVPADEGLLVIRSDDGELAWSHANANLTHPAIY